MLQQLFSTESDITLTILRIVLAVVIFPHGAQKLLGWFGGHGFKGTMGFFTGSLKVPSVLALGVILIEFFAPILLLIGLATRAAALAIAVVMIVAVFMVHLPVGFFMNWFGAQQGEGYEFHLLVVGIAAALLIGGGGAYALDAFIALR